AEAADQQVAVAAAIERIVAVVAHEDVPAAVALHVVGLPVPDQDIVPRPADGIPDPGDAAGVGRGAVQQVDGDGGGLRREVYRVVAAAAVDGPGEGAGVGELERVDRGAALEALHGRESQLPEDARVGVIDGDNVDRVREVQRVRLS